MKKIEDIKTPTNLEEFRQGLKKYCLGYKDCIFIYNKINNKIASIDINKISKMSDIFKIILDDSELNDISSDCNLVLMCDISHINLEDLIVNKEDVIRELKEVYLFNNQDIYERTNFLNSTSSAIDKIVNGEKVINETNAHPYQTALDDETLGGLYNHLFGEYFDTINFTKKKINLSKYN